MPFTNCMPLTLIIDHLIKDTRSKNLKNSPSEELFRYCDHEVDLMT